MSNNDIQQQTTVNIQEKANLIWAIADKLVGVYKPHEYGNVILPMCVIKRFEDTLYPTKKKVLKKNEELDKDGIVVKTYSVTKMVGGGWMSAFGGNQTRPVRSDEKWTLDACFPFAAKDSHKKTSCKALIMAHAYSNVVMDKIEECIKNGLTGNENDNW